jgi:hypothetical protein
MNNDLLSPLPCPHCGGPAELKHYHAERARVYYGCADSACHYTYTDPLEALEAWNRRVNDNVNYGGSLTHESKQDASPPHAPDCNDWIDALAKRWEREAADETCQNPMYEEALENCAFDLRSAARQASGYAQPRWTAEKPAAAGWWWCETMSLGKPLRMIVQVSEHGSGLGIYCGWTNTWSMINEISARWAGPLPEPMDAPTRAPELQEPPEGEFHAARLLDELEAAYSHLSKAALIMRRTRLLDCWDEVWDAEDCLKAAIESERCRSSNEKLRDAAL